MLSFANLQQQLAFDVANRFTKKVFECTCPSDLILPTQALISEVTALALPELQVVFRPKEMPPQEEIVEQEDSKDQSKFDLMAHIAGETRAYLNFITTVGFSMAADVENLQK